MSLEFSQTYATNVFPFIKPKEMNKPIPPDVLMDAARTFALPQIKIINPLMVICLGIATFNAIRAASVEERSGDTKPLKWNEYERAIGQTKSGSILCLHGKTAIRAVTHLGAKGRIRREDKIEDEWQSAAERLKILRDG